VLSGSAARVFTEANLAVKAFRSFSTLFHLRSHPFYNSSLLVARIFSGFRRFRKRKTAAEGANSSLLLRCSTISMLWFAAASCSARL
jgi:hypothetical protein